MTMRRKILIALGMSAASAALTALAQLRAGPRRIGYYSGGSVQNSVPFLAAFREGMAELGWVEVRDYVIDARHGDGDAKAMPALADELLAARPDLLLTVTDDAVRTLAQKTGTIPIVMTTSQDPVANGVAASLRRPGGNVTGLTGAVEGLTGKHLQLLKEAVPRLAQVALLLEPANVSVPSQLKDIEAAAVSLRMRVSPIEIRQAADIEAAFKRGAALGAQGYVVSASSSLFNSQRQALADGAARAKVPAIFPSSNFADAGGLLSYGFSPLNNYRRAAAYVDKIFKGAKPGELPIEQPTRYEMAVNLKTAKALGLTIPQSVLLRADRVIK